MARSDNAADGRWVADPEGTRIFCPLASSFRLHDDKTSCVPVSLPVLNFACNCPGTGYTTLIRSSR